jgi:tetrapyrrole methylase family protein/MazG family protein
MAETSPGITLLGLGPGNPRHLTCQARDWLMQLDEIYLRTGQHPVVSDFPASLTVHTFDSLYASADKFEEVYSQIVETVLTLGRRPQGVTYAVPGSPFVAEATAPEIARRARAEGLPLQIIEGMSFLEPVFSALGMDPFPHLQLLDAFELGSLHHPNFQPDSPALITQVFNTFSASAVKLTLNAVYPDEHPVQLVHQAGTADQAVENIKLYEIDRSQRIGLLTALYIPPLAPDTSLESFQ